jgi:hypothetical protein
MIIESIHHGAPEAMVNRVHDTCFLLTSYQTHVTGSWMDAMPYRLDWPGGIEPLIAALCVGEIDAADQKYLVCDAYIAGPQKLPESDDFEDISNHLEVHRAFRWEDRLDGLLSTGKVTPAQAKKGLRGHDLETQFFPRAKQLQ